MKGCTAGPFSQALCRVLEVVRGTAAPVVAGVCDLARPAVPEEAVGDAGDYEALLLSMPPNLAEILGRLQERQQERGGTTGRLVLVFASLEDAVRELREKANALGRDSNHGLPGITETDLWKYAKAQLRPGRADLRAQRVRRILGGRSVDDLLIESRWPALCASSRAVVLLGKCLRCEDAVGRLRESWNQLERTLRAVLQSERPARTASGHLDVQTLVNSLRAAGDALNIVKVAAKSLI
ncbi:MAG: hypothetical protein HZA54_10060 [Planctomycetes bacterium]|nr:hypothetical protein [Planctomycetota bacterium]